MCIYVVTCAVSVYRATSPTAHSLFRRSKDSPCKSVYGGGRRWAAGEAFSSFDCVSRMSAQVCPDISLFSTKALSLHQSVCSPA